MHNHQLFIKPGALIFCCVVLLFTLACGNGRDNKIVAPWGETPSDSAKSASGYLSVSEIVENGELIVATVSGPDTYFEYHGRGFGTQYILCDKFASGLGVSVRVEVCKDTAEMVRMVKDGEVDLIACMLPKTDALRKSLRFCGAYSDATAGASSHQWAVANGNGELAEALDKWFAPGLLSKVKQEERYLLSSRSVKRHVYAPYLDRAGGVISRYDGIFRRYASLARWDWRMLAAQCYQESCFDPEARSWAGARGLMQIMPGTADHLGLAREDMNNPERSVEAACRLLAELEGKYSDIPRREERQMFVLASYNGGVGHIRDAMALARRDGADPRVWRNVAPYILRLQQPQYYNDPLVKNGYMRGSETVDYVDRIRQRYAQYRGAGYSGPSVSGSSSDDGVVPMMTPRRATKKYKYKV